MFGPVFLILTFSIYFNNVCAQNMFEASPYVRTGPLTVYCNASVFGLHHSQVAGVELLTLERQAGIAKKREQIATLDRRLLNMQGDKWKQVLVYGRNWDVQFPNVRSMESVVTKPAGQYFIDSISATIKVAFCFDAGLYKCSMRYKSALMDGQNEDAVKLSTVIFTEQRINCTDNTPEAMRIPWFLSEDLAIFCVIVVWIIVNSIFTYLARNY